MELTKITDELLNRYRNFFKTETELEYALKSFEDKNRQKHNYNGLKYAADNFLIDGVTCEIREDDFLFVFENDNKIFYAAVLPSGTIHYYETNKKTRRNINYGKRANVEFVLEMLSEVMLKESLPQNVRIEDLLYTTIELHIKSGAFTREEYERVKYETNGHPNYINRLFSLINSKLND